MRVAFVLLAYILAFAAVSPASARRVENEALTNKFRKECAPQFKAAKQQGRDVFPLMQKCVLDKLAASWKLPSEFKLVEFTPWTIANRGPSEAPGLVYFIQGWGGQATSDDFRLAPYFTKSLNMAGWDVIGAKFPESFSYYFNPKVYELANLASISLKARLKELRQQGYKEIILVGHSWGGWVSSIEARDASEANALILSSPSNYGTPRFGNGAPNPFFKRNVTELLQHLSATKIPVAAFFFKGDNFIASDMGERATLTLEQRQIPYLMVDKYPGFYGHYAAWLPVFDFAIGNCIAYLLKSTPPIECFMPELSSSDFRAIVHRAQLSDAGRFPERSAERLVGRKFATYRLADADNKYFRFISRSRRTVVETDRTFDETFEFRGEQLCVVAKCATLIAWSETEMLEFGLKGELKAWWVEDK